MDNVNGFNVADLLSKLNKKVSIKDYISFIFGIFLVALSFSIFYSPNNIVCGGTTGLSIIFRELFGLNTSLFVAIASLILLIVSLIFLGWETTTKTVVGTILYPLFLTLTDYLAPYIGFHSDSLFLQMLFAGIINGIGSGLILKTGFSTGGSTVLCQMLNKYAKISIGTASIFINSIIITLGAFIFGIDKSIYALITLYISSVITDRVILGISDSKTFYIVTDNEEEVKHFIIDKLHHTATIIDARGGYSNKKNKIIMATIPTKEYFMVKQVVYELDKKAFFLITDTYEVQGGK